MNFITVKYPTENYKVNLDTVEIIQIYDGNIEFKYNYHTVMANKFNGCLNYEEIKEIVENL